MIIEAESPFKNCISDSSSLKFFTAALKIRYYIT